MKAIGLIFGTLLALGAAKAARADDNCSWAYNSEGQQVYVCDPEPTPEGDPCYWALDEHNQSVWVCSN